MTTGLPIRMLTGRAHSTVESRLAARVSKARPPLAVTVPLAFRLARLPFSVGVMSWRWLPGRRRVPSGVIVRWRDTHWYVAFVPGRRQGARR